MCARTYIYNSCRTISDLLYALRWWAFFCTSLFCFALCLVRFLIFSLTIHVFTLVPCEYSRNIFSRCSYSPINVWVKIFHRTPAWLNLFRLLCIIHLLDSFSIILVSLVHTSLKAIGIIRVHHYIQKSCVPDTSFWTIPLSYSPRFSLREPRVHRANSYFNKLSSWLIKNI